MLVNGMVEQDTKQIVYTDTKITQGGVTAPN
jgi:hypothetical protein